MGSFGRVAVVGEAGRTEAMRGCMWKGCWGQVETEGEWTHWVDLDGSAVREERVAGRAPGASWQ